ncbi:Uncharacterized protein ChrSV_0170 [Chromobacterium vaccinii]|nr:Uncharacterized protein ChrSW_0170 [Chromobacterium vaccinii]QND87629.1 Uncharacterized protein ChrSV_0170 [Chromobacterium vaccinii]
MDLKLIVVLLHSKCKVRYASRAAAQGDYPISSQGFPAEIADF